MSLKSSGAKPVNIRRNLSLKHRATETSDNPGKDQ